MCGRYASTRRDGDLLRDFQVASVVDDPPEPSWNLAPTDPARVVLDRMVSNQPDRQLRTLSWGLVPSWAKDPKIGAKLINARSETVTTKSAFKAAASRRRCLVPADGYYEWMVAEDGKHPIYLYGDGPLAFAGLYELRPLDEDRETWSWTFTILTCTATDEVGHIHDRSPVVVPADLRDAWLDPTMTDLDEVRELVAAIPPPRLHTYEVAPLVNSVRNNGPELIEPVKPVASR
ncbi:MAG TPA: SOS response-associated peptidase [Mycobacteriales bacterium]|nr:SOS response-associated peptidase [Mycobacteriales bacterium]